MKKLLKLLGITVFLVAVYVALLSRPQARSFITHRLLGERVGLEGILTLGVGMLIITGGIDLSMGSLVALCSTVFGILVVRHDWSVEAALLVILGLASLVGVFNGVMVTKLRLQPFMVTLCGLFIFRSLARRLAGDSNVPGLGHKLQESAQFYNGGILGVPVYLLIFMVLVIAAFIFLHLSVSGRYYFALGSNERAARFAGIAVDSHKISAYVVCSLLTGLFSYLNLMKTSSVEPASIGENLELYAIAAAVLGGCSLRGGEGTVYGMVAGTAIIVILRMMITFWDIPSTVEGMVIGGILLLGVTLDEILRWRGGSRSVAH